MKILLVDDEPLARARLQRFLEQDEQLQVVAEVDNGERAIAAFNKHRPDIILMDIRMPVMDGLEAARHLARDEQPPAVIFCTAYDDYALQAFEANAVDYLLKPVNREKLLQSLHKAQRLNRVQLMSLDQAADEPSAARSHLSVKTSRGIELIPVEEVRYFLADQKYVTAFYYRDDKLREVLLDDTLKELELQFSSAFIRVHRNALVAVAHITGLERTESAAIVKIADVEQGAQVSRRHLAAVRKLLQEK